MAEKLGILVDVDVKGGSEVKQLKGQLNDLGTAGKTAAPGVEATGKSVGGMTGAVKGLLAGGLLLGAGHELLAFGKASITAASDVQEMQSKFDTVFGSLGGQVTTQLDSFANASNRSKTELMGFAATLQDTLKPMGIAAEEAAGFSVDLVKLGTDLSSFNNMPMDEAMRRLQGTLIGSHENALAFGVVINENTLKAELAAQGWSNLTGAQLEAAKVQARINLLMAGTSDAQGDAIKTADSYANQVKGMEAAMADLQVAIGSGLLPVMTDLVGLATQTADRLSIVAAGANEVTTALNTGVGGGRSDWDNFKIVLGEVGKVMSSNDVIWEDMIETAKEGDDVIERHNSHLARQAEEQAAVTAAIEETIAEQTAATAAIRTYHQGLSEAAGPNQEFNDKILQSNNLLTDEEAALARSRAELNLLTGAQSGAASATGEHVEQISQLQGLLTSLPSEMDVTVNLQTLGINTLERAQRLLNSLQNPSYDPYGGLTPGQVAGPGPDPYAGQTGEAIDQGIDPVKEATNSSGYKQ